MQKKAESERYDEYYFHHCCGAPYERNEHWLNFFAQVAEKIIRKINPRIVLDVGCAKGFLVEALRDRGVEAYGIDVSEYAISQVREDVKLYCRVASILDPLDMNYDLVTCIEVLEHLPSQDAENAIRNMTQHTERILFSSTPADFKEVTHHNVQPLEYWAKLFAQYGFFRDLDFDASFIVSHAICFKKVRDPVFKVIGEYERKLWWLTKETQSLRELAGDLREKLRSQEQEFNRINEASCRLKEEKEVLQQLNSALQDNIQTYKDRLHHLEQRLEEVKERAQSLMKDLAQAKQQLKEREEQEQTLRGGLAQAQEELQEREEQEQALKGELTQIHQQLQGAQTYIAAVQSSIGWRLLERIRHLYLKLFPSSTRRGRWFSLFLAVLRVWTSEGFKPLIKKCTTRIKWRVKYNTPVVLPSQTELPDINAQYRVWLEQHKLTPEKIDAMVKEQQEFAYKPKITIVTPVYNIDEKWLRKAIESVRSQIYPNWELCIVNDGSTKPHIKAILDEYRQLDNRIKVKHLEKNYGIAGASNHALAMASGEFVGFLDHDDELTLDALFEVVKLLNKNPKIDLIYSDEDKIERDGRRVDPYFKPDWSPDLLISTNYICHFSVFRERLLEKIGGLRKDFDGAQDYDLNLRATEQTTQITHIPKVLYSWRMVPGSAALSFDYKDYAHEAGRKAVAEALHRRGIAGTIEEGIGPGRYIVRYQVRGDPLVSVIIPTKDQVQLLQRCIESIERRTNYRHYELIIIDNNSSEPETLGYLESLATKCRVLKYPGAFNYSAINNFGARNCKGDYLLFLNNGVEVKEAGWLTAMLEQAQRPEVGVVGAKLLYFDETVQHVGVILGMGNTAGHPFYSIPESELMSYFYYVQLFTTPRNYSAVTGACMMVQREIFERVGGFNTDFKVAYGDIDLCLRVGRLGNRIVYTPLAVLYYHDSATRKGFIPEEDTLLMLTKWGAYIERGDPYYNPNLTLDRADASLKI